MKEGEKENGGKEGYKKEGFFLICFFKVFKVFNFECLS